jgi:hypothetical protein
LISAAAFAQQNPRLPPRNRPTEPGTAPSAGGSAVSDVRVEAISHSSVKIRFKTSVPGGNTAARVDYDSTPQLRFRSRVAREGGSTSTARSRTIAGFGPSFFATAKSLKTRRTSSAHKTRCIGATL